MRSLVKFALFAMAIGVFASGFAQDVGAPLSINISTPTNIVKAGSEIRLDIVLKNTSRHDVRVVRSKGDAELDYEIDIRDQKGKPTMETPYGRKIHGKDSDATAKTGSWISGTLKPDQEFEQCIVLNKVYDLSPGTYVIQLQRRDLASKGVVKSNKIVLTVTE
jgi:hypothetical protein